MQGAEASGLHALLIWLFSNLLPDFFNIKKILILDLYLKTLNMKLKQVKLVETGNLSEDMWDNCVQYLFEGREDTISYIIPEDEYYYDIFDIHLIDFCGCAPGEKIVIERGNW